MLKNSRRFVAAAIVVAAIFTSTPVFAAPANDDSPIGHRIVQIIRYVKHLLAIAPSDEPTPPKP